MKVFQPLERRQAITALVLNAGSSSVKYGLFEVRLDEASRSEVRSSLVCSGLVDKIGLSDASITHKHDGKKTVLELEIPDHDSGLRKVLELLTAGDGPVKDLKDIKVVGHRVVHGGEAFTQPAEVDDDVEASIERVSSLAPLHNPANLVGIRMARSLFPDSKHVAVFDTAFHSTMPAESFRYAIPKELYEQHNVRRYGMHGTSYKFVTAKAAEALKRPLVDLSMIVLHLGNGASMACVRGGRCMDTTMGLTPLEGLVMGTRSGDIDPGVYTHLCSHLGMTAKEVDTLLNKRSGLLGVCGTNDMRDVIEAASKGDQDAHLARALFVERVRKYLGAYLVKLGGQVDAVVFTGGIGENDKGLRELVCGGLRSLGIDVDTAKNSSVQGQGEIQSAFSRTKILVVPTDEEQSIALQSLEQVGLLPRLSGQEKIALEGGKRRLGELSMVPVLSDKLSCLGNAIYVDGTSSTTVEEAGLLYAILPRAPRIGYFSTFKDSSHSFDLAFVKRCFHLEEADETMYGLSAEDAMKLLAEGNEAQVIDSVLSKFVDYKKGKDFVLVHGGRLQTAPHMWNAKMAAALNVPMLYVTEASRAGEIALEKSTWECQNVKLAGVILKSHAQSTPEGELRDMVENIGYEVVAMLPDDYHLKQLTVAEIASALSCEVLYGEGSLEKSTVNGVIICTCQVNDLLDVLQNKPGQLIIVDARRADTILSFLLASQSRGFPRLAGILLVAARHLDPIMHRIITGLDQQSLPVLAVDMDTMSAGKIVDKLKPALLPSNSSKVEVALQLVQSRLDPDFLEALVTKPSSIVVTPKLFQHNLFVKAREEKQRIVLPEGEDPRVVTAAAELLARNLCDVVILGKGQQVANSAAKAGCCLEGAVLIDTEEADIDEMVEALYQTRKAKGMSMQEARDLIRGDPTWFGTMMMQTGKADGMVSGACHSTANTMRPALQVIKMASGFSFASSVFFMLLPDGVKVFGDCAINVDPTAEQLAEIGIVSARTARAFGIDPKIAMLSYATGDSNQGPMIDKVRQATELLRQKAPDEKVEGPIQFDAAVDKDVAAVKFKGNVGPVAGSASVLIFPDLNAGNTGYKAVQQSSKCIAIGPVMQGLRKPVNDLSRGCTVDDIVNTVVITCLQSMAAKSKGNSC